MLHQEAATCKHLVAARVAYVRPYESFLVWPVWVLVAVAEFAGLGNFEGRYVVYIIAGDVHEWNPALVGTVEVVNRDGIQVVCAVAHGAVIAVPVKVRPAKNHVSRLMHKNIYRKFARHVRHLMVREFHAIASFVGPSGMRPQALSPSFTCAGVHDVDRFGGSVLVVVVTRKVDLRIKICEHLFHERIGARVSVQAFVP